MKTRILVLAAAAAVAVIGTNGTPMWAQGGRGAPTPPADPNVGVRLDVAEGSRAVYRVREQLAGISFRSDAVGATESVTGTLVIGPGGVIDSAQSRLTVDLTTLKSDQDMRDGFIRGPRGLDTEKFPTAEFVPRRAVSMPWPFPTEPPAQAGFQLVGDMTVYGRTEEVTWNIVATFNPNQVAGRAETEFTFGTFGIPKPQLARLMSVEDTIRLELEVRFKRAPL